MKAPVILLMLLIVGCASVPFEDWDSADTTRQVAYTVTHVIDYFQTKAIARNDDFIEMNPVLGEYPSKTAVDIYMLCTLVGHVAVSGLLEDEWRERWQVFTIGMETATIINNHRIGVRW